ncbi:hypothetical protein Gorai_003999 [Gossypium raimondii]|uniref:NB-ARC domain-containing protein n=1 Tax=Gossypium raimondii TaxID=29730 RepID=A0A7J8QHQ6_GOSRA|nr:hypothetical protein [Gossypium raimondii]
MAEALLGAVVNEAVAKVIPIAAEQISLAWGFKKQLKKLGETLGMIEAFLQDAEEKQTKNTSVRLEDVAYEAVDVLDEFAYEILRRKVEIRNQILRKFLRMEDQRWRHDHSNIVGRKHDVSKVVNLLVNPKDKQVVSVVPIVGMAGLGKTTLAKLVYDDMNVKTLFDVKFWVCVSDHLDVKRILKEMLERFTDNQISVPQNKNAMVEKLKQKIEGAKGGKDQIKYLLVLDDVWDATE